MYETKGGGDDLIFAIFAKFSSKICQNIRISIPPLLSSRNAFSLTNAYCTLITFKQTRYINQSCFVLLYISLYFLSTG
jgi:hypothetical protein